MVRILWGWMHRLTHQTLNFACEICVYCGSYLLNHVEIIVFSLLGDCWDVFRPLDALHNLEV
jgi:hypothetical protein